MFGPTCRFYPSCSAYAITAVERHGVVRGSWLTVRRLLRCNPWNPGVSTTCRRRAERLPTMQRPRPIRSTGPDPYKEPDPWAFSATSATSS
ncbi:membrane protein insertion efficiency factor YidD [Nocardioides sambongensis]|uniref:membrane protein insertion efficiency factor YidD n=1 Tax=Nocardioides sambongensis TaxID=2589074 RepID=UPI001E2EB70A|nr:membrane protein insertion efficiency factor YidD [Nocardioides sambongensis]